MYPNTNLSNDQPDQDFGGKPSNAFGVPAFQWVNSILTFLGGAYLKYARVPYTTEVYISGNSALAGDVAAIDLAAPATGGAYTVNRYSGSMTTPAIVGIYLEGVSAGGKARIATHGTIPPTVTGLNAAAGTAGLNASTGRVRIAVGGDIVIGSIDPQGNLLFNGYGSGAGGGTGVLVGDVIGPPGANTLNTPIATAVTWNGHQSFELGIEIEGSLLMDPANLHGLPGATGQILVPANGGIFTPWFQISGAHWHAHAILDTDGTSTTMHDVGGSQTFQLTATDAFLTLGATAAFDVQAGGGLNLIPGSGATSPPLDFVAYNSTPSAVSAAAIEGKLTTATAGSEASALLFATRTGGASAVEVARLSQGLSLDTTTDLGLGCITVHDAGASATGLFSDLGGGSGLVELVSSQVFLSNNSYTTILRGANVDVSNIRTLGVNSSDSSGIPGAATINKQSGRSAIAAGASAVVITNSTVASGDHVQFSIESNDGTATKFWMTPGVGSFTLNANANATGAVNFSWLVHKAS